MQGFILHNYNVYKGLQQKIFNRYETVIMGFFIFKCNIYKGLQKKPPNCYTVTARAYKGKFYF